MIARVRATDELWPGSKCLFFLHKLLTWVYIAELRAGWIAARSSQWECLKKFVPALSTNLAYGLPSPLTDVPFYGSVPRRGGRVL